MEVVNRTLEMYLRCFTSSEPKQWNQWLTWAEFCYNTSVHSSTGKTPFEVVYGRPPLVLLNYVPGPARVVAVEEQLIERDDVIREVREKIVVAQNRMKRIYDGKHKERDLLLETWFF